MTDATTAVHCGTVRLLSNPQPRLAPSSARPTAVVGSRILKNTVFIATIARLLGQRLSLEYALGRRGAAASQRTIALNMAMNTPSLIVLSCAGIVQLTSFKYSIILLNEARRVASPCQARILNSQFSSSS